VQNLDDRFSSQQSLLAAIHCSETASGDQLANDELSKYSPEKVVYFGHLMDHSSSSSINRMWEPAGSARRANQAESDPWDTESSFAASVTLSSQA